jgi:hypothetical protein
VSAISTIAGYVISRSDSPGGVDIDIGAPGASDVDDRDRALALGDPPVDETDTDLRAIGEWLSESSEFPT